MQILSVKNSKLNIIYLFFLKKQLFFVLLNSFADFFLRSERSRRQDSVCVFL